MNALQDKYSATLRNPSLNNRNKEIKPHELHTINTQIQEHIQKAKEDEEKKIAREIKHNPKAFYDYIERFRRVKTNVGQLRKGKHYYSGLKAMTKIISAEY